jgi:hypothetical protein
MNFSTVMAAIGLLTCIFLAIRMALPARSRQQLDARLRRAAWSLRDTASKASSWLRGQRHRKSAANEAEAAIRRAQSAASKPEGEWDGNVYRPKSFDKSKKPRKLH